MPQILLKNEDNDEILDIDQETHDKVEELLINAVDSGADWDDVEDELDNLLAKGRVSNTMSTINFKSTKPNFVS